MNKTTQKYKNVPAYGSKLLKMHEDTYQLRRKVINVIYKINDMLRGADWTQDSLPRIEVRIVSKCYCDKRDIGIAGYAYTGHNIIHIPESTVKKSNLWLTHVVFHEVLHAIGFPHKDKCPIMDASGSWEVIDINEQWDVLEQYLKEYFSKK